MEMNKGSYKEGRSTSYEISNKYKLKGKRKK